MTAPWLDVHIDQASPFGATLRLKGELEAATCRAFQDALASQVGSSLITVDLRSLHFMDSSGIHCLLDAHRVALERDQRIQVIAGSRLSRLVDVSGIRSVVHFVDASGG